MFPVQGGCVNTVKCPKIGISFLFEGSRLHTIMVGIFQGCDSHKETAFAILGENCSKKLYFRCLSQSLTRVFLKACFSIRTRGAC